MWTAKPIWVTAVGHNLNGETFVGHYWQNAKRVLVYTWKLPSASTKLGIDGHSRDTFDILL